MGKAPKLKLNLIQSSNVKMSPALLAKMDYKVPAQLYVSHHYIIIVWRILMNDVGHGSASSVERLKQQSLRFKECLASGTAMEISDSFYFADMAAVKSAPDPTLFVFRGLMELLVWKRNHENMPLSIATIREYLVYEKFMELKDVSVPSDKKSVGSLENGPTPLRYYQQLLIASGNPQQGHELVADAINRVLDKLDKN